MTFKNKIDTLNRRLKTKRLFNDVGYKPTAFQKQFHTDNPIKKINGTMGCGKSTGMLMEIYRQAMLNPGTSIAVYFHSFYLRKFMTERARELWTKKNGRRAWKYMSTSGIFTFNNTSKVETHAIQTKKDIVASQGKKWDTLCIDNKDKFKQELIHSFLCMHWNRPIAVWKNYIETNSYDIPFLDDTDKEFCDSLQWSEKARKQLLDCDWKGVEDGTSNTSKETPSN